jgi:RND family efflux transporter MFP subunit
MLRQIVISALLVAGAWGLWSERAAVLSAFGMAEAADAPAAREARPGGVPVIVAPVRTARDRVVLEAVGTGRAARTVTLRAEAEGRITEMALAPGRRFAEGEVLLRLDDGDERLAVARAEARLAEARRVRARYDRLSASGAAAEARLDEVATAAEIADIALAEARAALADRTLRAPFDGVAGLASVEVGDRIDTGTAIARFDDRSTLLVEFPLPEAYLARVAPGMTVTARTPAQGGRRFEGRISAIDTRIDAGTRTTTTRAAIPNAEDLLRPGASFTVRLALDGPRRPLVPELALQFSRGSLHVWRVADGRAERVAVELVRRRAGAVLVDGPLAEGERVVVEGTQRLRPGRSVRVIGARGRDAAS